MRARRTLKSSLGPSLSAATLAFAGGALAQTEYAAPEPPPAVAPWYDTLEFRAFADAYASLNYNFPKPQSGANDFRAYDTDGGFALSWVGADVSYAPAPVGGAVQLRFGPTATRYAGADAEHGLEFVKQAFASWRPGGDDGVLTLDFGKFDTIYGFEVAESQDDWNYTRGLVYWFAQPLFHTGLRAKLTLGESVALQALAVNGWNNSVDNNAGKSFGAQIVYTPTRRFATRLGWLGGPEQDDTTTISCPAGESYSPDAAGCAPDPGATEAGEWVVDRGGANELDAWRHLVDLVVTFEPIESLALALNADFGWERLRRDVFDPDDTDDVRWFGVMAALRYELTPVWAVAGRGEYLNDLHRAVTGHADMELVSGTLTLEAKPTPNLVLRLEQRGDFAVGDQDQVFRRELRELTSQQLTTTLGVVVTTH